MTKLGTGMLLIVHNQLTTCNTLDTPIPTVCKQIMDLKRQQHMIRKKNEEKSKMDVADDTFSHLFIDCRSFENKT